MGGESTLTDRARDVHGPKVVLQETGSVITTDRILTYLLTLVETTDD